MTERPAQESRPFRPEEMEVPLLSRYRRLQGTLFQQEINSREWKAIWQQIEQILADGYAEHERRFPPGPPNDSCRHAILAGVHPAPTSRPAGSLVKLMKVGHERLFVWNSNASDGAYFVVEVAPAARRNPNWKQLSEIIRLAIALNRMFESFPKEVWYEWANHFDPRRPLAEQDLLFMEPGWPRHIELGMRWELRDVWKTLETIELLYRDDVYFRSAQCLLESFERHWFCLTCELREPGDPRPHENHEAAQWDNSALRPRAETAILQAVRCCEGILGKPKAARGKDSQSDMNARWESRIVDDIPATWEFPLTGQPVAQQYRQLFFNVRKHVAHHIPGQSIHLTRSLAIEAQCLAWVVLYGYYLKHCLGGQQAAQALQWDSEVID